MDEKAQQCSSYQLDQEILDARGISITVEEVAGLPTVLYTERVQSLKLTEQDLMFLKGLRRRIKNRLASQNSRRRNMEHLRRLSRELRAVRACLGDIKSERDGLISKRDSLMDRCKALRDHIQRNLKKSEHTEIPCLEFTENGKGKDIVKDVFECRIDKLVQQSVNHIYKSDDDRPRTISARTVFVNEQKNGFVHSDAKSFTQRTTRDRLSVKTDSEKKLDISDHFMNNHNYYYDYPSFSDVPVSISDGNGIESALGDVLNLSKKTEMRRSHGRKQTAPRRIAYTEPDDYVLDLKVKKEIQ